ncbi:MAG: glycosyltransferase family 2 protein [Pseudomonadota bacterium]
MDSNEPTLALSAVIICNDPAPHLARCLRSLAFCDEVLLYLNGAADDAGKLAESFDNVRAVRGEFSGFGPTKQAATELARHDWILSIDSDESVDGSLQSALGAVEWSATTRAYTVLRQNYFLGQHVQRGGWGNDTLLRVFNRKTAAFNDKVVHEKVVAGADVTVTPLSGTLRHEAISSIDQFLEKIGRYSALAAQSEVAKPGSHPLLALLRAHFAFFRSYVLQLGFLAGWRGVVIAQGRFTGTFFRYTKRFARQQELE